MGSQLLHFLWISITFHGNGFRNKDLLCRCGGCVILPFAYSETPAVPAGCRAKRAGHLPVACKDGGEHVSALRRAPLRTYSGGCTAVLAASKRLSSTLRALAETRSGLADELPARESPATLFGWRVGEQGVFFGNLRYPVVWGSPRRKTLNVSKMILE